jgi:hypothetical protein
MKAEIIAAPARKIPGLASRADANRLPGKIKLDRVRVNRLPRGGNILFRCDQWDQLKC